MADEQVTMSYSIDTADVKSAEKAMDGLRTATDKAEKSARNMGRATLEGGRILQDFAQGGVGGILNNIEGLSLALGGGPGLAGVMTAVGLAAYFAGPAIKATWAAVVDGTNDVPDATDKVGRLSEAFKTLEDRLKELKDKGWLTDSELSEYNGKLAQRLELEGKITAEKKAQATFDKLRNEAEAANLDKDAAAAAKAVVQSTGGIDATLQRVGRNLAGREQGTFDAIGGDRKKADAEHLRRMAEIDRTKDQDWWESSFAGPLGWAITEADRALQKKEERERHEKVSNELDAKWKAASEALIDEAKSTVEAAVSGDPDAAAAMLGLDPTNAAGWVKATRGGLQNEARKKDAAEVEAADERRRLESEGRAAKFEIDKAEKAADESKKDERERLTRDARKARRREDMEAASSSTPEELAQSEAIEAIQKRGVGKDWTDKEWIKAAEQAVAASDMGMGGRDALGAGIAAVSGARAKLGDAAQLRGLEGDINRGTGGQLTAEQVGDAAKKAQGYIAQGANPDVAKDTAVRELIQANAELMRTIQELQDGTAQSVQAARWQRQQASQMRQMNPSILNRGGG